MTELLATISKLLADDWTRVEPVRVGGVPAGLGTPDRYVTVTNEGDLVMRLDVYAYGPDCFAFQDAIVWQNNLIVGFGSHVHAISLADRSAVTIPLASYFGHLYPTHDYLLLASGERLFRMHPDRSIAWQSAPLGIDGVVVHEPGPPTIHGEGEWDPPGGWRPFAIDAANGSPA